MSCLSCLLKNMLEDSVAADVLSRQVNDGTGAYWSGQAIT